MCSHENVVTPRCVHGTPDQYRSTSARSSLKKFRGVQYPRLFAAWFCSSKRADDPSSKLFARRASNSNGRRYRRVGGSAHRLGQTPRVAFAEGQLFGSSRARSKSAAVVVHDAALEGNDLVGSVSAVMFDRLLGQPAVWQFFGSEIVGPELSKLQTGSMKVIIALEVLPVVATISVGVIGCCSVVSLCL